MYACVLLCPTTQLLCRHQLRLGVCTSGTSWVLQVFIDIHRNSPLCCTRLPRASGTSVLEKIFEMRSPAVIPHETRNKRGMLILWFVVDRIALSKQSRSTAFITLSYYYCWGSANSSLPYVGWNCKGTMVLRRDTAKLLSPKQPSCPCPCVYIDDI